MTQATDVTPIGGFCWYELNTRDVANVKAFYSGLFGWTTSASDSFDGDTYHHWHDADGAMFGGILDMKSPEWGDMPSHWMSYVRVADVDALAARTTELGGQVCVPPFDMENVGRLGIINDPTGGTISLIRLDDPQPVPPIMGWTELMTRDAAAAAAFYAALLGWETESMPMGEGPDYLVCRNGGEMTAGIMQMEGQQFEGVPTNWMNYVATDAIDTVAAKISGLGGTVDVPPTEIPGIGHFCTFSDPGGGHIAMFQPLANQ